jgi:ribosomal protein L11 methylase PrmA
MSDVRRWRPRTKVEVVTANLFSELLIEILPAVTRHLAKRGADLILSGIMRNQERAVVKALERNNFSVRKIRRRGKWIAVLAKKAL